MSRKGVSKNLGILLAVIIIVGISLYSLDLDNIGGVFGEGVDDWQYSPGPSAVEKISRFITTIGGLATSGGQYKMMASQAGGRRELGYSVGGAKDINNFRDNIENDYLPIPTDIPYEGLFYEYYFDTGQKQECKEMFCPSYSQAVTEDPLSGERERYMTVGLNSNLDEEDFERKKLNLVLVLDISGSMGSSFSQYYYDQFGNRQKVENYTGKKKIKAAAESLAGLTEHLEDDDRLGVVLFNNNAHKAKPMRLVEDTDMEAIRDHILELKADGGTNMDSGMTMATDMLDEYKDVKKEEYENRIIFLTDMMPNIGTRSKSGLLQMMKNNSQNGIYTTFVGMGVDFNTELTDAISKVEGANSFAVHSSEQFKNRMDKNFEYIVTPLVFNLTLQMDSDSYDIKKVYGSTAAEESTGEIMKVRTLFPSRKKEGKTKGGIVLLQLEKTGEGSNLDLTVRYEKRTGEVESISREVTFEEKEPEYFENDGIRKAVLLTRYANLMKNWMIYERARMNDTSVPPKCEDVMVNDTKEDGAEEGIAVPYVYCLGKWERQSKPLVVSEKYNEKIKTFKSHFQSEMKKLGDETLEQETKILGKLSTY